MQRIDGFKVRDFREKGFFVIDDLYLNGYARYLDPHATVVYMSLCRHADKKQRCFPSQKLIAEENGIGERTVRNKLNLLEKYNMIKIEKMRNDGGKWLNQVYYLLDKSEWKTPPTSKVHMDKSEWKTPPNCGKLNHRQELPTARDYENHRQELPIKDTHIKDTHTTDDVEKFVDKCRKWAYGRASVSPSCSEDAFVRAVVKAVRRVGLDKVHKQFEYETNAITFLTNIKDL